MLSAFKLARLLVIAAAVLPMVACEEDLGLDNWTAFVDTTTIYSLSRAELLGRPSAYDFFNQAADEVETPSATGSWDFALLDSGNQLVLLPAGGFQGNTSRAGLALITGTTFEDLREAPSDTARYSKTAAAVQVGQVYAVRTRRDQCSFVSGVRFGKMKIIAVDPTAGSVTFASIVNPYCNERLLIPDNPDD